jgi:hypothetical protein
MIEEGKMRRPRRTMFALRGHSLREPVNSTNSFRVRFPVICRRIRKGEIKFAFDSMRMQEYFDLHDVDLKELSLALCDDIITKKDQKTVYKPIDPQARRAEYQALLDDGTCRNRADIARHYGVSRAWVTKVMNRETIGSP